MSELIQHKKQPAVTKRHLLASVSALAMIANAASQARAEDADHPSVWIELGGQLERVDVNALPFVPVFSTTAIDHGLPPPASVQKGARYGYGGEGSITFAPGGSSWEFSASIRYGRSNASKSVHQQTKAPKTPNPFCVSPATCIQPYLTMNRSYSTADNRSTFSRSTVVVDFKAGKDVGLGLFGSSNARFDLGVRFAQFTSASTLNAYGIPYPHWEKKYFPAPIAKYIPLEHSIAYHATAQARRSFSGVGPTLTWHDSTDVVRSNADRPGLAFDWSINGGLLFGRQKAKVHYKTKIEARNPAYATTTFRNNDDRTFYHGPFSTNRAHSVVVPNIGGQAALSLKFPNAKVTFGYRADFFFGAMDAGIEAAKSRTISFHGPFASVSIGLGG